MAAKNVSVEIVEAHCVRLWEEMLHFLVGAGSAGVGDTVRNFFVKAKLMTGRAVGSSALTITALGYEYVLKDQREQVLCGCCLEISGTPS
jgi:hypothetical protein